MRYVNTLLLALVVSSVVLSATATATVPTVISYQGRLTDSTGAPLDTAVDMTFTVFDDMLGTAQVWSESHTGVVITDGLFTVLLGSANPLMASVFDGDLLGLRIQIGTTEADELIPLTTVAYSFRAVHADTAAFALSSPGGGSIWTLSGGDAYYNDGNVGIGTETPLHKLDVNGSINTNSVYLAGGDTVLQALGNYNVGVGKGSGVHSTGSYNTFVGAAAAPDNQGHNNVMVGQAAGHWHTSGDNNTFVGMAAGNGNISGDRNTFIGKGAGQQATGSDNVFLGRGAGYHSGHSNALIIDNGTTGTPLVHGDFLTNRLGVNIDDPESNLEVDGRITSSGSVGGYKFYDRGGSLINAWTWYANNSLARLQFTGLDYYDVLGVTTTGNMGIGSMTPGEHRLYVESDGDGVDGATSFFKNTSSSGIGLMAETTSNDATAVFVQHGNGDALHCFQGGAADGWNFLFRVTNTGRAICNELELLGGADLAEPFAMSGGEVPAGALVVIDDQNPGKLKLSNHAYDTRVAGIVSGAGGVKPGLTLSQKEVFEDGQNVAINGRVYCLADASYGAIKPGDLLTTSDTPGHAMSATDRSRAYGSVIGKAMSSLDDGRGLVLVLVNLQ